MTWPTIPLTPDQRPRFSELDLLGLKEAADSPAPGSLGDLCAGWTEAGRPGLETATALLYDRILKRPENRAFLDSVLMGPPPAPPMHSIIVGIVPGAFYREHPHTGADGARIAALLAELGMTYEVIPIQSFGRVNHNARILSEWLRAQGSKQVLLVTLSKGGADVKAALNLRGEAAWGHVKAWVNVSGLVQGTPLIAWFRDRPLRLIGIRFLLWCRGQRFSAADDLRHQGAGPRSSWPPLPSNLRLVHVLAFPLARHLRHRWAFRAYRRLAPLGPNDGGGILLEDAARVPGIVCPLWGLDHYLAPAWDASPPLRNILLAALASPPPNPPEPAGQA